MKIANLTDSLINKVESAKSKVEERYYKEFKNSKSGEERELIFAKLDVLKAVTSVLTNDIRGDE